MPSMLGFLVKPTCMVSRNLLFCCFLVCSHFWLPWRTMTSTLKFLISFKFTSLVSGTQ